MMTLVSGLSSLILARDENKLVIELDGNFHKFQIKKDNLRTEIIEEKGIKVFRFKNDEIEKNMDKALCVLEKILTHS